MKNCKYCNKEFENGWKLGGHIVTCIKNPTSTETIKKQHLIRIKKLKLEDINSIKNWKF